MKAITLEMTKKFAKGFEENNKQQALQRAVVKNGITASAENVAAHVSNTPVFSIDLYKRIGAYYGNRNVD